jgi:hypothetical protein
LGDINRAIGFVLVSLALKRDGTKDLSSQKGNLRAGAMEDNFLLIDRAEMDVHH